MLEKATALLFEIRKLMNYAWFFGCTALGIAAITGMVCIYCRLESRKQGSCAAGEASDIRTTKKCADK